MNYDRFLKKTKNLKCPHCKKKKWRHDPSKQITAFLSENKDINVNISGSKPGINLGFLICTNCGYVKMFSELSWEQINE